MGTLADDARAEYDAYVNRAFAIEQQKVADAEAAVEQLRISNKRLREQRDEARKAIE